MTNHELFRLYTSEHPASDNYIDATWLFIISAALQRRVWLDSSNKIFPNQYIILVAPPGTGKSITSVAHEFLTWFKEGGIINDGRDTENANNPTKLLFPCSANSTTFEKFVETLSANRQIVRAKPTYIHCSTAFVLDELTSLFKKESEAMMSLLLSGWVCVGEFEHTTIKRGCNYVKNMCVNMIAGTQPDTFTKLREKDIITSGLSRRLICIWESKSRVRHFLRPTFTPEQLNARGAILSHLLQLARLYGPCTYTPEAMEYVQNHFADAGRWILNKSPYLANYYSTKNEHFHKIAMAFHFGESTSMTIGLPTCVKAIDFLERIEQKMHLCYAPKAQTDVADSKDDIIALISTLGSATTSDIYTHFYKKLTFIQLQEAISDLVASNMVKIEKGRYVTK